MKKIIAIFFAAFAISLSAQNEGIQFIKDSTLQSALVKAKQEHKLLFIDCYTSWCGPCKYLAKVVFPNPEVGQFFNQHFISWGVDTEKIKDKADVEAFKKFNILAWPTLLFLDGEGNIVHRAMGAVPAKILIELGKQALDSTRNLAGLSKKISHGDRSSETLSNYYFCDHYASGKYIDEHFALVDDSVKLSKSSWNLFVYYMKDIDGEAFHFFVQNRDKYVRKFGKEAVDNKLNDLISYYSSPGKEKQYNMLAQVDTALFSLHRKMVNFGKALSKYRLDNTNKELWGKFISLSEPVASSGSLNSSILNDISWMIYENYKKFNDIHALNLAQTWSKKTVDAEPGKHAFNDTYAHILFDLGNKEEAIQKETLALKQATEQNAPDQITFYTKELKRFKGE